MDRRLLDAYERELTHLREMGVEFARAHPKIAGRLGMSESTPDRPRDPYVERLLEGFAFLAARVQLKLDDEFPQFTQALLQSVYPHYLAPTPSMAVVRLEPDFTQGSLAEGFALPRGTLLRSREFLGQRDQTRCVYRSAHDLTLWPLEIVEAEYYTRNVGALRLDVPKGIRAAVRIRLRVVGGASFPELPLDRLTVYLRGDDLVPLRLYEQLFAHARSVVVRPAVQPAPWHHEAPAPAIRRVGFDEQHALLPYGPRSFHGYRLLHEYFAFPARYQFLEISGLGDAVKRCEADELDIIVLLDQEDLELEDMVDASRFVLFCTPAINLFEKRADRIDISDRYNEFHVVPDRTCPLDYEVYDVLGVTGYGSGTEVEQVFEHFYAASDFDAGDDRGAYFAVKRLPRVPAAQGQSGGRADARSRRRSRYLGSEVWVSLVDGRAAPYRSDLRQLSVTAICTNRDLPLLMREDRDQPTFQLDQSAPVMGAWCEAGPTRPRPSPARGEQSWRLISHLMLNYLSITDEREAEGATALRDLLRLYVDLEDHAVRKQIEGLKSVESQPLIRRVKTPGPISFARGLEVSVLFEDAAFEGTGVFLLGAVLEQFFSKYVSINSFTETVVRTARRGEIMRWPARMGLRHIL